MACWQYSTPVTLPLGDGFGLDSCDCMSDSAALPGATSRNRSSMIVLDVPPTPWIVGYSSKGRIAGGSLHQWKSVVIRLEAGLSGACASDRV